MSGPDDSARLDPQRLIASLPLAVLVIAPDMTIASANPAAEQLLGQGSRLLIGRKIAATLVFAERHLSARLEEGDAQLFARGSTVRVGGQARRLDVMLAPVAGHPGWQVLSLHASFGIEALGGEGGGADAAPLRAPEVLAHEIKNPLAGIRGAAQLLARHVAPAQRALTDLITAEVDRVTKLIDQMQSLSRKRAAPRAPFNVHEALRSGISVLKASEGPVPQVVEEFDPSLPPVLCSPDALVQVALNLLSNARNAAAAHPQPKILVRTRFASGLRLHGQDGQPPVALPIEIRISDNGPGVDAELGEHIFEPFVSGRANGQGLGLALVKKLVHEMDGRVTFDRDDAKGLTHFRVQLPVAAARALAPRALVA